ncbi:MAG: hypothetical protein KCHDKBKB_02948 [Elusimicrobia bacterium]|nr:hypothetical protein [Elusimicrobiota bacterium]
MSGRKDRHPGSSSLRPVLGRGDGFLRPSGCGMAIFCVLPLLIHVIFFPTGCEAKARRPAPGQSTDVYSLADAQPVVIPARKTKLPLIIYGEEHGANSSYAPSGFMGDSGSLKVKTADFSAPVSSKTGTNCLRVEILPKGREGWAGLYWQTPANNWGKIKGAGYNLSQAKKLTFWARGEHGGERIAEVKVGGLIGPYPDTDSISMGPLRLNKDWTFYTIDLQEKDLRHIVGGFAFSVRRSDNPRGAVFYLDEIMYAGEASELSPVPPSTPPAPAPSPTPQPVTDVPPLPKAVKFVVPFSTAKTAFAVENREGLDEMAAVAKKYPTARVLVQGHTDNVGSKSLNKTLSYERAKAVADYLISQGVAKEAIEIEGFGEEQPIREGSNETSQGRMENRRVEVHLVPRQ